MRLRNLAQAVLELCSNFGGVRMRPSSSKSRVAKPAAHATGLPPKVLPWEPGGQLICSARAMKRTQRQPEAMPLARAYDVGLDIPVLGPPAAARCDPFPTGPRRHEQDAVLEGQLAQSAEGKSSGGTR